MAWCVGSWHEVEGRAVMAGLIARPGAPSSLMGSDVTHLLAFCEAILRETPEVAEKLDGLYKPVEPPRKQEGAGRKRAIEDFVRDFG